MARHGVLPPALRATPLSEGGGAEGALRATLSKGGLSPPLSPFEWMCLGAHPLSCPPPRGGFPAGRFPGLPPSDRGGAPQGQGGVLRAAPLHAVATGSSSPARCFLLVFNLGNAFARNLLNLSGNSRDVIIDGMSSIPKNLQAERFEKRRPAAVSVLTVFRKMTPPVNLHNELCAVTVEVHDVVPNRLLSLEAEGELSEPAEPKASLLVGHVVTEFARTGNKVSAVMSEVGMNGWHRGKDSRGRGSGHRKRRTDKGAVRSRRKSRAWPRCGTEYSPRRFAPPPSRRGAGQRVRFAPPYRRAAYRRRCPPSSGCASGHIHYLSPLREGNSPQGVSPVLPPSERGDAPKGQGGVLRSAPRALPFLGNAPILRVAAMYFGTFQCHPATWSTGNTRRFRRRRRRGGRWRRAGCGPSSRLHQRRATSSGDWLRRRRRSA